MPVVLGSLLLLFLVPLPGQAHPHEWIDWGAGVVLEEKKPLKVTSLLLELTWDEWFSALLLEDFPGLARGTLKPADLQQLDTVYGLAAEQRAVTLNVTWRGKKLAVRPKILPPRTDGRMVTFVYELTLGLVVDSPGELRISAYDPTFYADMGIRAKAGAFFRGVRDPARYEGSFAFEQDRSQPYFGDAVFPEVVVFALKP